MSFLIHSLISEDIVAVTMSLDFLDWKTILIHIVIIVAVLVRRTATIMTM